MRKRKTITTLRMALIVLVSAVVYAFPAWAGCLDHGDGTVTDTVTQLTWQKADDENARTWIDALRYCERLDLGGYTDWRLPNYRELGSLVDDTRYGPAIDPVFGCRSSYYWSGSTGAGYPYDAWSVGFDYGYVDYYHKYNTFFVRCVREGPSGTFGTLTISKSGTGTGRIVSAPTGIDCGSDCREDYALNTSVTLTATADSGSTFAGWSGGTCSGTGTCTLTVDRNMSVVAIFNQEAAPPTLIGPGDNNSINDKNLTFEWSAVDGAIGYELQVDNDCEFNSPEVALYLAGGSITSKTFENYLSDGTYCWKVRAKFADGSYSAWSTPSHFTYHLPVASKPFWVPLYRLYNSSIHDHYYTTILSHKDDYVQNKGYTYEKIESYISDRKFDSPYCGYLFHLWDTVNNIHLYTSSETEKNARIIAGFSYQGIVGFIYTGLTDGAFPLYHLEKTVNTDHFYTSSKAEHDNAISAFGFVDKEIVGYVSPAGLRDPVALNRPQGRHAGIDTATGAFRPSASADLSLSGVGPELSFTRYYNSASSASLSLGPGWSHSLYNYILESPSGDVIVKWGNGSESHFTNDGHGNFAPDPGIFDTFNSYHDSVNDGYDLITKSQTKYAFRRLSTTSPLGYDFVPSVFLIYIEDRNGNRMNFNYYASNGALLDVTEVATGRKFSFQYDLSLRLTKVTDNSLNRSIFLAYDSDGYLSSSMLLT